ncbi:MAG: DUF3179 domain-containing protein, partial [Bacteroidetes bacterium]
MLGSALLSAQKNGFTLSNLLIPESEIHHGGPPRDGIPAIERPRFVAPEEADFLNERDLVLGVVWNGIAKAYPIAILDYHEIVNDDFGGEPVAVTWCPLCGSGVAFRAEVDGQRKTFGVSGLLYNSDVLLYDRQTESLWSQIRMQAVSGPESGKTLELIPTLRTTFGHWKTLHPQTLVLSPKTGFQRNYAASPYGDYPLTPGIWFPVAHRSRELPAKELVLGLEVDGNYKAYPYSELRKAGPTIRDTFQGRTILIRYERKSKTAIAT